MWLKKNSGYIKFLRRQEKNEKIKKRAELYNFINLIQGIIKEGNKERSKENNINTNNINKEQE